MSFKAKVAKTAGKRRWSRVLGKIPRPLSHWNLLPAQTSSWSFMTSIGSNAKIDSKQLKVRQYTDMLNTTAYGKGRLNM